MHGGPVRPTKKHPEPEPEISASDILIELPIQMKEQRLLLKLLKDLAYNRIFESDMSPRVQLADDLMHIAVRERIVRMVSDDLENTLDTTDE